MPSYLCHGFRWHRASIRLFVILQKIDDAAPDWVVGRESSTAIIDTLCSLFDFLPGPPALPPAASSAPSSSASSVWSSSPSSSSPLCTEGVKKEEKWEGHDRPTLPSETLSVAAADGGFAIKLLEEYDPSDLSPVDRPYAYVTDHAVRVDLSASVMEEMARYEERLVECAAELRPMTGPKSGSGSGDTTTVGGTSDESARRAGWDGSTGKRGTGGDGNGGGGDGGSGGAERGGWLERLRDQLEKGEDIRWYVVTCGDEERPFAVEAEAGEG